MVRLLTLADGELAWLRALPKVELHVPRLVAAGLRVCLNTDDPGWFATDLVTQLATGSEHFGVTRAGHLTMQVDAMVASVAPDVVRAAFVGALDVVA